MDYEPRRGSGVAALRWEELAQGSSAAKEMLVALMYGRIQCAHKESRAELFRRVNEAAVSVIRTEGASTFEFEPYRLHVGHGVADQLVWPWPIVDPALLPNAKAYSAVLNMTTPGSLSPSGVAIDLKMTLGQERVLAPASTLAAITGFARTADPEARYLLALRLWQMNEYWGTPDRIKLMSESIAYATADAAIRSGQLRVP